MPTIMLKNGIKLTAPDTITSRCEHVEIIEHDPEVEATRQRRANRRLMAWLRRTQGQQDG